ncbi:MAG: CHAT domain-containing protein [Armatimonadetes bacterium]|nr:CHAT domain-containing protein [Armatimonadota bacterium]
MARIFLLLALLALPLGADPPAPPDPRLQELGRRWALVELAVAAGNPGVTLQLMKPLIKQYEAVFPEPTPRKARDLAEFRIAQLEATESQGRVSQALELGPSTLASLETPQLEERTRNDLRVRLHLVLARAARRAGRLDQHQQHLQSALEAARKLETPAGKLGRFTAETLLFALQEVQGRSYSDAEALDKMETLLPLLSQVPPTLEANVQAAPLWAKVAEAVSYWSTSLLERSSFHPPESPESQALRGASLKGLAALGDRLSKVRPDQEAPPPELERPWVAWNADVRAAALLARLPIGISYGSSQLYLDRIATVRKAGDLETAGKILGQLPALLEGLDQLVEGLESSSVRLGSKLSLREGSAASRLRSRYFHEMGLLASAASDWSQAADHFASALDGYTGAGDALGYLWAQPEYALVLHKSGQQEAREAADLAVRGSEQAPHEPSLRRALLVRAEIRADRGDRAGAIQDLLRGIELLEREILWIQGTPEAEEGVRRSAPFYDMLARLQAESGDAEQAFETISRFQQVNPPLPPPGQSELAVLHRIKREEQGIEQELAALPRGDSGFPSSTAVAARFPPPRPDRERKALQERLADTRADFLARVREIRSEHPEYAEHLTIRPVQYPRLQSQLPAEMLLLQYFAADDGTLYIFVGTSKRLALYRVQSEPGELARLVGAYRRAIVGRAPESDYQPLAAKLYSLLVEPVESELQGHAVVAVLPSGALFYLPFHALGHRTASGFRFLSQDFEVVTLAQAVDLFQLTEQGSARRAGKGVPLIVGNPDGSLPDAEKEAREIAALLPGSRLLLGAEATADRLASTEEPIGMLHLATHGRVDSRKPDASYLVMAGNEKLDTRRVVELDLAQARLVTLSACETTLGASNPGSEVSSLAEAFWYAGSPTVVASLWKVSDASTRRFMVEMYGNLSRGDRISRAIQKAQGALIADGQHAHPFHWAAFVLWGDWR